MPEAPFGSVTPMWSTVPTPAFGYAPTPVPSGQQSINPYGLSSAVPPFTGLTPNTLLPLTSPLAGAEIRFGVTAPTLLTAIGMRRGQPLGPTSDNEIEDFIYDALELLSGASDVEVRSEGGRVALTGSVPQKRLKHDIGEIVWTIPVVNDVQNNIAIATRRRSRGRESETPSVAARKQA